MSNAADTIARIRYYLNHCEFTADSRQDILDLMGDEEPAEDTSPSDHAIIAWETEGGRGRLLVPSPIHHLTGVGYGSHMKKFIRAILKFLNPKCADCGKSIGSNWVHCPTCDKAASDAQGFSM